MEHVKTKQFQIWLDENEIEYKKLANGHFQIFNEGKLLYQVWATTERMVVPDKPPVMGFMQIARTIKQNVKKTAKHNPVTEVRKKFVETYEANKGHMYDCILVVAVYLPSGATEIITNHYDVEGKMEYYLDKYDDEFRLKANPQVKVTGFMLV